MSRPYDVAVVGGGIIGLATAMTVLWRHPSLRLLLLEREAALATQQTGHNSGVIHSGLYYTPGSLKARTCVRGRRALVAFCREKGIRHEICGKLVVALDESELERLAELHRRSALNEVEDVDVLDGDGIRAVEPACRGIRALHVRCTGIIDFTQVAWAFAREVEERGGEIRTARAVVNVRQSGGAVVLETSGGSVVASRLISCGGLFSDRLAAMAGAPDDLRVVPFRGDYYVVRPEKAHLCRTLIYPVPDPSFPWLGVHFTRRLDGSVWAGPNAVLAFARKGYGRWDFNPRDTWDTLSWPGFWALAGRYWRTGLAEMWRDYSKAAYLRALRAYIPDLAADDLLPGPSGVRAQALSRDGQLVDDFAVYEAPGMIHVRNAPSPAATSSLGIAEMIADRADASFGW
ncbi:MAG: L-2-hydroxyglutarate oxidase [Armatimonadetes bacterium]|nr:L-2-hydroxyglutarate oxidase [Armatimonadota bacterium]